METDQQNMKKRPGWVWAISVFYFFSCTYTLFSWYMVSSGRVTLEPAMKAYLESLTAIDIGLSILIGLAGLTGAVTLFLLRRQAFYFFSVSLGFNLLQTIWHILSKGAIQALRGPGTVGMFFGLALVIAVCAYSWRLVKRGVLS